MSFLSKFSPSMMTPTTRAVLGWLIAAIVSIAHVRLVFSIHFSEATFLWMYPLMLAVPALVSIILLPGEIRHWYRWAAVLGLSFSVYADVLPAVLVIGGTYALHRAWVVERRHSIKDLVTFKRGPVPAEGPAGKKTDSRSPKAS